MAFHEDLRTAINANSMENGSNTPDWVLRDFLCDCLDAWNTATNARRDWSGPKLTDEERQAIEYAAEMLPMMAQTAASVSFAHVYADTLRKLLERLS